MVPVAKKQPPGSLDLLHTQPCTHQPLSRSILAPVTSTSSALIELRRDVVNVVIEISRNNAAPADGARCNFGSWLGSCNSGKIIRDEEETSSLAEGRGYIRIFSYFFYSSRFSFDYIAAVRIEEYTMLFDFDVECVVK